jgi:uncharacterized membrane protein
MAKQQQRSNAPQPQARKTAPAPVRRAAEKKENIFTAGSNELIFGRLNFIYMGIGLVMVLLGLAVMSGGSMPDPNVWEPERIYSPMRITVAPILMVAGFVIVAVGIFKRKPEATPNEPEA